MTNPVKPRTLATRIEDDGETVVLTFRDGPRWAVLFPLLWLSGWTVACTWLLYGAVTKPSLTTILFGIPFWASWLFVAGWVLNILFGWHRVIFSPEGLAHEWFVLMRMSHREVPLEEIQKIQSRLFSTDSEGDSTYGIEVVTLGKSVTLGLQMRALERDWLASFLQERLDQLRGMPGTRLPAAEEPADCRGYETPSDSSWQVVEEFPDLVMEQRGKFDAGTIAGLAFVCLFWNGIVGVFVALLCGGVQADPKLEGGMWWGLFVFLLPFELVGLGMMTALVLAVLEPFRVMRWRIGPEEVEQRTTRLGLPLGRHKLISYLQLGGADVKENLTAGKFAMKSQSQQPTGEQFGLLLTDGTNQEICSITGLTRGEARWMKGQIQTYATRRGTAL
ncbi:MAG: hypothetical protein U0903_11975 [Planctomycetales bacterium]